MKRWVVKQNYRLRGETKRRNEAQRVVEDIEEKQQHSNQAKGQLKSALLMAKRKRHGKKSCGMSYFSENIIFNIFCRLPAHKVHELRYGCKQWSIMITSPHFIDAHLRVSQTGLIVVKHDEGFENLIETREENFIIRKLTIEDTAAVLGTCNGLVVLIHVPKIGIVSVANPCTGQLKELPRVKGLIYRSLGGISFLDSTNKYKVSLVVRDKGSLGFQMLTLGSNKWKWLNFPSDIIEVCGPSLSTRGVIHVQKNKTHVLSFDTTEEKFYTTKVPFLVSFPNYYIEMGGCLSIVDIFSQLFVVWVLKDLQTGLWVKQLILDRREFCGVFTYDISNIMVILEDGNIIFWGREFSFFVYDAQLKEVRRLNIDPRTSMLLPHVESLVLL